MFSRVSVASLSIDSPHDNTSANTKGTWVFLELERAPQGTASRLFSTVVPSPWTNFISCPASICHTFGPFGRTNGQDFNALDAAKMAKKMGKIGRKWPPSFNFESQKSNFAPFAKLWSCFKFPFFFRSASNPAWFQSQPGH